MEVLVALVAAAESKTKAEAAGKLRLSISALDKRFRTATSLYGVPLIRQSDSEIRLTEEGEIFYSSAVRSVEFASLAEQNTRAHLLLKTNHILVGHSSYLPPGILAMVHGLRLEAYPRVRVKHRAGLTSAMVRAVQEGEMLAGFGFLPFNAPDLVVRKVWEEPLVVCMPSSHPAAGRTLIRPEDLNNQAFVAVGRDPLPGAHEEIESYFGSMGISLNIAAEAFAPTEALNLVEQRIGICILSQSSAAPHRGVTVRPLWTRAIRRESAFFYRDDNRSPLISELSRTVMERARHLGLAAHAGGEKSR